jgi:multidrug transporter EmrE-like cation transporter
MIKMKLKKPNLTKLIKAIIFIAISVMFLTVTFYEINFFIEYENFQNISFYNSHFQIYGLEVFSKHFAENSFNYVFSILFALLGILELKEAFSNGD